MKHSVVCPDAAQCGACDLIGLSYPETLTWKQRFISGLLKDFGPVEPIVPMEKPLYYRCKVHRVFSRDRQGRLHCGNYRPGSHFVADLNHCLIEDRTAQRILGTIRDLALSFRIPIYDEDRGTGLLRHALIRIAPGTGEILAVLVMAGPSFPGKRHFIDALRKAHPEITSLVLNLNTRSTTMVLGEKNLPLFGPGFIHDRLGDLTFRLSPGSFYQVNPVQTRILYAIAADSAGLTGQETVVDAYCGIGTIGLTAAPLAGRVIGVELNPEAVRDAKMNARLNRIENAEFIQGDAGDFLDSLSSAGKAADVIFLDPPRSGSTEKFLSSCVRLAPRSIVYVSCGPESLRRDLRFLTARGYQVSRIRPVDMFPFTKHIETVVLISGKDA